MEIATGRFLRQTGMLLALATALSAGVTFAQAKTTAPKAKEQPVDKKLDTKDRLQLAITYYKSNKGKEAPVVILLHQEGGKRGDWKNFALKLQDEGYAVVAVDLRHHGESLRPGATAVTTGAKKGAGLKGADYQNMVAQDLEAVKAFLVEEHEAQALNIRKTGIIASGMSVPIALSFAVNDWLRTPHDDAPTFEAKTPRGQDVRALVLLSPEENVSGINTGKAMQFLRNPTLKVAAFIGCGDKDKLDKGQSKRLYDDFLNKEKEVDRYLFQKYEGVNDRGTDMLGKKTNLEAHILGFLKTYLMDLNGSNDEWRSRKSRLAA